MATSYYAENIQNLPVGLTRGVGRIMERAIGHDRAVPVDQIVKVVTQYHHIQADERQVRAAVEELRNAGMDIVNLMDGAGYFIPAKSEKDLYIQFRRSYTSRAKRIWETVSAMDATARRKFGPLEENPDQLELL